MPRYMHLHVPRHIKHFFFVFCNFEAFQAVLNQHFWHFFELGEVPGMHTAYRSEKLKFISYAFVVEKFGENWPTVKFFAGCWVVDYG